MWCDSSSWTAHMRIHDMHLAYSCSSVDSSLLRLLSSWWVMNESFRSLLLSESIYKQILETNEIDENCMLLREVIARDKTQYEDIKLKNCWTQNEILYHDNQLWVSFNELLQMNLIRKMHDQSSVDYSDILRTVKVIKRNYYWSFMWKTIDWYIWNCYICQRSKTSRNKSNDLL